MGTRKKTSGPMSFKIGTPMYDSFFNFLVSSDTSSLRNSKIDNTLLSVARLLLKDRISKFTVVPSKAQVVLFENTFSSFKNEDGTWNEDVFYSEYDFRNSHSGIGINLAKDGVEPIIECHKYDDKFKESGWIRMSDVEEFISKEPCAVYQSVEKQSVYILIPFKDALRALHKIAVCIPRLFSWAFEEMPLTENEDAMLKAIDSGLPNEAEEIMAKIFDFSAIEKQEIMKKLNGISNAGVDADIRRRENDVEQKRRRVREYMDMISSMEDEIFEQNAVIGALMTKKNSGEQDKELADFIFANNGSVHILRKFTKDDGNLRVGITCFLDDYDERLYKSYIVDETNPRSYVFNKSPYDFQTTKDLFIAIFGEHRFNIRTYCEWRLKMNGDVEAVRGSSMGGDSSLRENRIQQPHIDHFTCYSGFSGIFSDLGRKRDFVGLISTALASSHSINWTDSTVVSYFMDHFFNADNRFLEDSEGNLYTRDEVVKILNDEKLAAAEAAKKAEEEKAAAEAVAASTVSDDDATEPATEPVETAETAETPVVTDAPEFIA